MSHSFLAQLRSVLKTLDDEALAALANKGLLRRAQKDLETSRPTILDAESDRIRLLVGEATVEVPESPARSTCSCPATGVCRHILAALVYLRDDPALHEADPATQAKLFDESATDAHAAPTHDGAESAGDAVMPSPADVLGAASDEALQKWAGKPLLKNARRALAADPQLAIEAAAGLIVRFPARNITCRWIPSGGLLGMVCSCQSETVCEHVVTAVLAYQVSLGRRQIVVEQAILQESSGAPRSRAEVLESVGTVLCEIVTLGLSRLSTATAQRLTTLAVSAHGVDLPRLERMLKSLADETQLALRRDAQSNAPNMLLAISRCEALRIGLIRKPTAALVGQHRTQYLDVGQITLVGLGAQHWRSKGGYHGLTLFFWDESRGGFATWSESRPVDQAGFNPVGRYGADGPWSGCSSPREASRSIIRLTGAWRNAQGRISGRPSTRALIVGPSAPSELPESIIDWSDLASRVKRLFGGGLTEQTENLELALLRPRSWGPADYDSLRQELIRPIFDSAGRTIPLWLPFTPENESAVEFLERHDPATTRGLLGALRLVDGRIRVQPISLFADEQIVSLNLERAGAQTQSAAAQRQSPDAADDAAADDEPADDFGSDSLHSAAALPLGRFLVTAQAEIEAIAESGIAVRRDHELLRSLAKRLDSLGLITRSRPLERMNESLGQPAKLADPDARRKAAGRLLHAYYVLQLAANQETVALACAGFA